MKWQNRLLFLHVHWNMVVGLLQMHLIYIYFSKWSLYFHGAPFSCREISWGVKRPHRGQNTNKQVHSLIWCSTHWSLGEAQNHVNRNNNILTGSLCWKHDSVYYKSHTALHFQKAYTALPITNILLYTIQNMLSAKLSVFSLCHLDPIGYTDTWSQIGHSSKWPWKVPFWVMAENEITVT